MNFWRMTMTLTVTLLAGSSWAGGVLEEINLCDPDAKVSIDNVAGEIKVRPWKRPEIRIHVKVGDDVERVEFSRSASHPGVEIVIPKRTRGHSDIGCDIEVECPPGVSLDIEAVSAKVDVAGITGEIEIDNVSGSITVKDSEDDVEIETVSGKVRVSGNMKDVDISTTSGSVDIAGGTAQVDVETVSGTVTVDADAKDARVHTTSGRINIKGAIGAVDAESVSGSIDIDQIAQSADVASMSGSVQVLGTTPSEVSLESFSGSVTYEGGLKHGGRLDMNSKSGTVSASLPENIDASFDISTMSGGIQNNLGVGPQPTRRLGPGQELDFDTGEGRARVELESFSGGVRLNGLPPIPAVPPVPPVPVLEELDAPK